MRTIAPNMAADAAITRKIKGSCACSHPRITATTGLAYVCVATSAGGTCCSSQVYAVNAITDPNVIRYPSPNRECKEMPTEMGHCPLDIVPLYSLDVIAITFSNGCNRTPTRVNLLSPRL